MPVFPRHSLFPLGRDASGPLMEALESPSWTTRFRAARLLGEIGDPKAVVPLKKARTRRGERKRVREVIEASLQKLEHPASA